MKKKKTKNEMLSLSSELSPWPLLFAQQASKVITMGGEREFIDNEEVTEGR
jgi:hypothetical protein